MDIRHLLIALFLFSAGFYMCKALNQIELECIEDKVRETGRENIKMIKERLG